MGVAIFCLIIGFVVGYLFKDTQHKKETPKVKTKQTRNVYLSYNERQRAKIRYLNDVDRIRELNYFHIMKVNLCDYYNTNF